MQSQQKRVKWSRGETAEAIEERTDTGVTQASVEFMENCIPDIYGNISRRPGLKILPTNYPQDFDAGFVYDKYLQAFPFYLTEHDYILVGIHYTGTPEMIRIKNGVCVHRVVNVQTPGGIFPKTGVELSGVLGVYSYRPVSFAQQNNYIVIADGYNVYKLSVKLGSGNSFTPTLELWKFTAGWYAPAGTQTRQVNSETLTGLSISGQFDEYVYTETDGSTTVYSNTDTGIDGQGNIPLIEEQIPIGSIIQLPNIGTYFRVEGYYTEDDNLYFSSTTFDSVVVLGNTQPIPSTGVVCVALQFTGVLRHYNNGTLVASASVPEGVLASVKCSASQTGYSKTAWHYEGISRVWNNWQDASQTDSSVRMFGSLMTPVADSSATDTRISVEYGYIPLQPEEFSISEGNYPHPKKLLFCEQRLWAGAWAFSLTDEYALTIGSQIARYNDLKNNYNQENEPITLDILTQYKERILHLVDYNGLKIMTDSYEYAYVDGGAKKQSANGSFEYCEPIVFDSLCLYIDSTGCQVKAMQYEFQSNIFDSTTINQFAPHDLVWYPWAMAQYEDKISNTGKYLFLVNREDANARLAVCNFVPGNQANIWNRWSFENFIIQTIPNPTTLSTLHSVVNMKNGALFLMTVGYAMPGSEVASARIVPAEIDFNAQVDMESEIYVVGDKKYFCPAQISSIAIGTLPNTDVAIYADGVFKFITTTDSTGKITADLSELTNVTVGVPISSKVISHPIDVGGKTKSIKKRIGKAVMSVHDTPNDARGSISINGKTGYMNPRGDKINFYGVTGMKDEIKYTITNKNGAVFHLESLLMNIEYGTLDS